MERARVLFAWELGANLGHIKPMVAIARTLAESGIEVVLAVRDLGYAVDTIKEREFAVFQAPVWPTHRHWGHEGALASYIDVLTAVGFTDARKLAAMVAGWDALLDRIEPDVVVLDHSPGLQIALNGRGIPSVAVGTPFTMPPLSMDRFPPLRADQAPAVPEAQLMHAIRKALGPRRAPPVSRTLVDLFRTDERVVFGLPELDPYRSFRREDLALPPEPLPAFAEPPQHPRLFLYLGVEVPYLEVLVQAIAAMNVEVVAYFRGEVGPIPQFLKRRGGTVYDTPPALNEVLPHVSHVVSQGGAFTSQAALTAGRPHLVVPLHAETELNLRALMQLGAAQRFDPTKDERAAAAAVASFIAAPERVRAAREAALTIAERPAQPSGLDHAIAAITRAIDQRPSSLRLSAAATAQPS